MGARDRTIELTAEMEEVRAEITRRAKTSAESPLLDTHHLPDVEPPATRRTSDRGWRGDVVYCFRLPLVARLSRSDWWGAVFSEDSGRLVGSRHNPALLLPPFRGTRGVERDSGRIRK